MDTDLFTGESPDHLRDHLRHGLSSSPTETNHPYHLAYHQRDAAQDEEDCGDIRSLYHDATTDYAFQQPLDLQYEAVSPGNRTTQQPHQHRKRAAALPLKAIDPTPLNHPHNHLQNNPHQHHHETMEEARKCQQLRSERKRLAIQREADRHKAKHLASEARQDQHPFHRPTAETNTIAPSTIDTYCFYQKAQRDFCTRAYDQVRSDQRPCSYTVFQHPENSSKIRIRTGMVHGPELLDLVSRPRPLGFHCELRLIMSPEHDDVPADSCHHKHYAGSLASSPFPFDPNTCENLFKLCEFHGAFFETSNTEHSHVLQNARVNTDGGTHSFYLGLGDTGRCNMKVFISHKECDRVTTVFIHDCSTSEKERIMGRLLDTALQALTLHPIFILVVVAELLHDSIWNDVKDVYHAAMEPIHEAGTFGTGIIPNLDANEKSSQSLKTSQNVYANQWRMGQLRDFLGNLRAWSREIGDKDHDQERLFRKAQKVMEDRVTYLEGSLDEAHLQIAATIHYIAIYRHWVDVHIANSANRLSLAISKHNTNMALDSRRDQSAVKAISVLSMVFLPASFFSGIFNLPFFDWKAPTMKGVVKNKRIFIFVGCVFFSTMMIMICWRIWFRFEKWRLTHGRGKHVRKDLISWMKNGFKQFDKKTQEMKDRKRKNLLRETRPEPEP